MIAAAGDEPRAAQPAPALPNEFVRGLDKHHVDFFRRIAAFAGTLGLAEVFTGLVESFDAVPPNARRGGDELQGIAARCDAAVELLQQKVGHMDERRHQWLLGQWIVSIRKLREATGCPAAMDVPPKQPEGVRGAPGGPVFDPPPEGDAPGALKHADGAGFQRVVDAGHPVVVPNGFVMRLQKTCANLADHPGATPELDGMFKALIAKAAALPPDSKPADAEVQSFVDACDDTKRAIRSVLSAPEASMRRGFLLDLVDNVRTAAGR